MRLWDWLLPDTSLRFGHKPCSHNTLTILEVLGPTPSGTQHFLRCRCDACGELLERISNGT